MAETILEAFAKALLQIDSEIRKKEALDSITPESIREGVSAIEKANYDANKRKISTKEAAYYLKSHLPTEGLDEINPDTGKSVRESLDHDCRLAGTDNTRGQVVKYIMDQLASGYSPQLDLPIMIAKALSIKDGKDNKIADSTITNYANYIAESSVDKSSPGANTELVKMRQKSIKETVVEAGNKFKSIMEQYPDIKDSLVKMAGTDITELQNLSAEHFCRATTGYGVGVTKS